MSGIEKEIDNLGRVVLPADFRHRLGLGRNDKVLVSLERATIVISPLRSRCALCEKIFEGTEPLSLCSGCAAKVKLLY